MLTFSLSVSIFVPLFGITNASIFARECQLKKGDPAEVAIQYKDPCFPPLCHIVLCTEITDLENQEGDFKSGIQKYVCKYVYKELHLILIFSRLYSAVILFSPHVKFILDENINLYNQGVCLFICCHGEGELFGFICFFVSLFLCLRDLTRTLPNPISA